MHWYLDKDYIRGHLKNYLEFQLGQGYELKDVKKALLKYGYDKELVEELCKNVDARAFRPQTHGGIKELNEDLYVYLQNLLVDYIKKEQEQGYTLDVIKKALINYGHHPGMVKKAVLAVNDGQVRQIRGSASMPLGLMLFLSLVFIGVFIAFLLMQTEAPFYLVVGSFAPCIVSTLLVYIAMLNIPEKRIIQLLPVVAVGVVVLLYVVLLQVSPVLRTVSEYGTILILNAVLGFIATGVMVLFGRAPRKKVKVEHKDMPDISSDMELEEKVKVAAKQHGA